MTSNIPPVPRPDHVTPVPLLSLADAVGARVVGAAGTADVSGATLVSGEVRPGDLYIGAPGLHVHGASFASEALQRGATAILTDERGAAYARPLATPMLVVDSPREVMPIVAERIYGAVNPSIELFGVTGTNGKTTTVHILEGILSALGESAGLSSTAERRIVGETVVSRLTTPESTELFSLLGRMRERGVSAAAIEVSAQALSRHRVDGICFAVAGFTNFSHDHLDDYASMEEYFTAKLGLFEPGRAELGVVSIDTSWGQRIVDRASIPVRTISSVSGVAADWSVRTRSITQSGTRFDLRAPNGDLLTATVPVIGAQLAADAGLAIAMLVESGRSLRAIEDALRAPEALRVIPGRTENVAPAGAPAIYVDFGHTAEAFGRTLDAVRAVTSGRVVMVFGADGDRDPTKRAEMAAVAATHSDILVITDHHPRFEDAASIRQVLTRAAIDARPDAELHVVSPPERAIRLAVALVEPGDAILWAGPGHQDYRDIRGVRTVYSAREEARAALRERGWGGDGGGVGDGVDAGGGDGIRS